MMEFIGLVVEPEKKPEKPEIKEEKKEEMPKKKASKGPLFPTKGCADYDGRAEAVLFENDPVPF